MDYTFVYAVHVVAVSLSVAGFFLRFAGVLMGASWARGRVALTLPHVNDTILLASAITLAVMLQMNPLAQPWLLAKILALLVYIVLGMVALKPHRSLSVRFFSGVMALLVVSYIVSVAITRNAGGWPVLIVSQ